MIVHHSHCLVTCSRLGSLFWGKLLLENTCSDITLWREKAGLEMLLFKEKNTNIKKLCFCGNIRSRLTAAGAQRAEHYPDV